MIEGRLKEIPDRKVIRVESGKWPKEKAEEYLRQLIKDYRERKKTYEPMNMLEDINTFDYGPEPKKGFFSRIWSFVKGVAEGWHC